MNAFQHELLSSILATAVGVIKEHYLNVHQHGNAKRQLEDANYEV